MNPTSSPDAGTTRRQLLRTSGIAAAAAAVLAACGTKNDIPSGASGQDPTTTSVMPTVPIKEPSEADKQYDVTVLRTATSLELLAVQLYTNFGKDITDADWNAAAAQFATDHQAAADTFTAATDKADQVTEPNAYIQENSVDPIANDLTSDAAILSFFATVESSIAATYVTAVGTMTDPEGRNDFAAYGAASARRSALLGSGGTGTAPSSALLSTADLIANDAYLPVEAAATN